VDVARRPVYGCGTHGRASRRGATR
jgi:hypothetical protein